MKIVIIWYRFGPYHIARLRGAAEYARRFNSEIVGLEIAQYDDVYAWDICKAGNEFERYTVFPNQNYHRLSTREIQSGIRKALQKIKPDVVAVNGWAVPEARSAIDWCSHQPNVYSILMSETSESDNQRVWWKEWIKGWFVRKCDAALVGGRKHAEYLKKMGFPDDRIFLGYDVVDNDYFEREASSARLNEQDLRSRFNFPQNYFFACTRFIARKNIDGLLRAYAGYRKVCSTQPWGLVIAGDGEDIDLLQELQNRLGIDGILWPGFLQYEELPVYYGLASAFIHPARLEPWGLVVNEAAASGLPLLVSKAVNAGKELVKEGENGFLFEPRQDADITRVLLEMTNASSKQRQAMSTCSKEIAAQWTPGRFGKQLFAAVQGARRSML